MIYLEDELEELGELEFKLSLPKIKWGMPSIKIGKFKWKLTPKQALIGAALGIGAATGTLPAMLQTGAKFLPKIGGMLLKSGGSLLKSGGKIFQSVGNLKNLLQTKGGQSLFKKLVGKLPQIMGQQTQQTQIPEQMFQTQATQPQPQQTNWLLPLLGLGALFLLSKK